MGLFKKKAQKIRPIPESFTTEDIRVESSICKGEKTIGFYDKGTRRLRFAELVRRKQDVIDFYRRYGAEVDSGTLEQMMLE